MYQADDIESARRIKDEMMERYAKSAPRTLDILEKGFDEVLTVLSLPRAYRKRLRTTNGMERLNEEIRRRDRVIRIYPSEESALRLIGALLLEQSEAWGAGKRYFNMDEYHEYRKVIPIKQDEELVRTAA